MELKEAKYMLAIAEYKSINKAAKALYISQPSLSKYLQNVESRLNEKLFSRIHNEYIPTYIGSRYLSYAEKMAAVDSEWKREFHDIKHHKKGELNIAIPIVRSACLIPDTVAVFHRNYPSVRINLYEAANSVENLLESDRHIDVAIYNVSQLPKQFHYQILGRSEIVLVLPKDHPLLSHSRIREGFHHPWIDLSLFQDEPFILLHDDLTTEKVIKELFASDHPEPDIRMRTRNSEVAIRMVQKGMGLTFATEEYLTHLGLDEDLACLSIGKEPVCTTMIAAFRPGQYIPKLLQSYIDTVKEIMFPEI